MSGLKDRMKRLTGKTVTAEPSDYADSELKNEEVNAVQYSAKSRYDDQSEPFDSRWDALQTKLVQSEHGSFLLRKVGYPLTYKHGDQLLEELGEVEHDLAAFLPNERFGYDKLLFLDLETTGLGSGAGNVPFMTAIGYIEQNMFCIEQAFIRHPAEEYAMLCYLLEKVQRFEVLVTYNGKSFDWPLVENRLIMNGLARSWKPKHIDLLHPSRSVWRNTLTSCKLSYVEEHRLGIYREEDVPGSLAPTLYFQYLAEEDPVILQGVFQHNEIDLLSLAALLIRFGRLLGNTLPKGIVASMEVEELVRTGLWLEKQGGSPFAAVCFDLAKHRQSSELDALLKLADRYKKLGDWQECVPLWKKLESVGSTPKVKLEACMELSKYYEHKQKKYDEAMNYAMQCLQWAALQPVQSKGANYRKGSPMEQWYVRIDRIKRKQAGKGSRQEVKRNEYEQETEPLRLFD